MEIQIEKGIGYSPREAGRHLPATQKERLGIGAIPLDAIFTPVKRVSYKIENMRVGERTDFDRLFLEIETDGTIAPEAAFSEALEILVKHFSLFTQALAKRGDERSSSTGETEKTKKEKPKKKVKKVKHEKAKKTTTPPPPSRKRAPRKKTK